MSDVIPFPSKQPTPEVPAEAPPQQVQGSYVQVVVETFLAWPCPACKVMAKSNDSALVEALQKNEMPVIQCPSCGHQHPIARQPERKVLTVDEAMRKTSYNPNLSPAANRVLGHVKR